MNEYRFGSFQILPPVVKNLLIINGLFFLATFALQRFGIDLTTILGLHYFKSLHFHPYQLLTYMFMHANFWHIFMNMFAVWMLGYAIENFWGGKRFLIYYLVTGFGAVILHFLIIHLQVVGLEKLMTEDQIRVVITQGYDLLQRGMNYSNPNMGQLNLLINTPTVGASGAVFGILLAFGMMFPNTLFYIYFLFPVKAKWVVIAYGAIELFNGISGSSSNIAHFAHLGGMLFGFFLLKYWGVRRLN